MKNSALKYRLLILTVVELFKENKQLFREIFIALSGFSLAFPAWVFATLTGHFHEVALLLFSCLISLLGITFGSFIVLFSVLSIFDHFHRQRSTDS